ncbi:MAG: CDP-glycerol glycerophosphotransferase family protein [Patescibacteria group bacterium]
MINFKKILLNLLFIPFYWFFSYIIPKKNNLIIFGSYFGRKFTGNPKYFYLYLLNKKDCKYNPVWITRSLKILDLLKADSKPVAYLYSFFGMWQILRAKYLVIESAAQDITGITFLLGNFNIINLWHGVGLKKLDFNIGPENLFYKLLNFFWFRESKLYKVIISSSVEFENAQRNFFKNNRIIVTGYPRNDIFFLNKEDISFKYKKEFERYEKVIAYLPTFRDSLDEMKPFSGSGLAKINDYLFKNNYLFVIKNHPLLANKFIFENYSNIVDLSNEIDDPQELLIFADILITDYSSVVSDFCLMNRPVIFYPYDYENYTRNRELVHDYYKILPGPFADNENILLQMIKDIDSIFLDASYQKKYLDFKIFFNKFIDGDSSKRIYELIENLNNFIK